VERRDGAERLGSYLKCRPPNQSSIGFPNDYKRFEGYQRCCRVFSGKSWPNSFFDFRHSDALYFHDPLITFLADPFFLGGFPSSLFVLGCQKSCSAVQKYQKILQGNLMDRRSRLSFSRFGKTPSRETL